MDTGCGDSRTLGSGGGSEGASYASVAVWLTVVSVSPEICVRIDGSISNLSGNRLVGGRPGGVYWVAASQVGRLGERKPAGG